MSRKSREQAKELLAATQYFVDESYTAFCKLLSDRLENDMKEILSRTLKNRLKNRTVIFQDLQGSATIRISARGKNRQACSTSEIDSRGFYWIFSGGDESNSLAQSLSDLLDVYNMITGDHTAIEFEIKF